MASDINKVTMIGRMVADPELKTIGTGKTVTNFRLANNRTYTVNDEKKEVASFFNCVAWEKLGEPKPEIP